MDHPTPAAPHDHPAQEYGLVEPLPGEACPGRDSACGRSCYLDNDAWTYETTMSIGGVENDVQAYCMCEHHRLEGSPAGLMSHIRERRSGATPAEVMARVRHLRASLVAI